MGFLDKRRRLLIRWTVVSGVILVLAILWSLAGQSNREEAVLPGAQVEGLTSILARDISSETIPIRFENVTKELGIDFRHFPAKRESLLPEDMGSGVAVGDFDGDGYPDLFFVNFVGSIIPDSPEVPAEQGFSKLYKNINGDHFEDVTEQAGISHRTFGMGAAWGDYDNDGELDLYITAYGPNV